MNDKKKDESITVGLVPSFPAQPIDTTVSDAYPRMVNEFSWRNIMSRVGNNDHTPITRPFTENTPKFYFTLGITQYSLRFVEEHEGLGSWAMFKESHAEDAPFYIGNFDVLQANGELLPIDIEDDNHDEMLEAIKDAIVPALRLVFKDLPGELVLVNFENGNGGTTFFIYPDEDQSDGK